MSEGTSVTFPKVYAKLGNKGGNETVNRFIARFNQEVAEAYDPGSDAFETDAVEAVLKGVDLRLVEIIRDGVIAAQSVAADAAERNLAGKATALEEERARLQAETAHARNTAAQAEQMVRQIESELSVARAEICGRDARIGDLQAALEAEGSQRTTLEARVAELLARIDEQTRRHDSHLAEAEARHAAQVAALRQDKESEIGVLRIQMKASGEESKRVAADKDDEISRLRAQVDSGRKDLTGALATISQAHAETSALRERFDRLMAEIESARRGLAAAEQAVAAAHARQEAAEEFRRAETLRANAAEAALRSQTPAGAVTAAQTSGKSG